nr:MAG TPA: hypothetical protein [Caudoviricetes sp.]
MCLALRLEATDRRARNVLLMTEYQWISRGSCWLYKRYGFRSLFTL